MSVLRSYDRLRRRAARAPRGPLVYTAVAAVTFRSPRRARHSRCGIAQALDAWAKWASCVWRGVTRAWHAF